MILLGDVCYGHRADLMPLRRRGEDVHIHFKHGNFPITAAYQMLPIYISLASLLTGRRWVG